MRASRTSVLFTWLRDPKGQNLLEYVLLGAFVSILVLSGASALGGSVNVWFDAVAGVADRGAKKSHVGGTDKGAKKSNCSAQGMASSHGKCGQ